MKYKAFKQKLTVALAAMMILASSTASFAANFNDLSQASWAKTMIGEWSSRGIVSGYPDGTFRPNNNITRAEFATLVQKAFELESVEKAQFQDVSSDAWYYSAVGTLASLGVVGGYEDGTFRPNGFITRAEAAAIMTNLNNLSQNPEAVKVFTDHNAIASWAKGHVGAAAEAKFMSGYPDGSFRASNTITRAESVATLNNVIGPVAPVEVVSEDLVINQAGTYGGTEVEYKFVSGNVSVNTQDVTLKNMVIEGNLILGEGIGEGDAILENVTVKGDTEVLGGGANSIYIRNSRLKNIIVAKKNNSIRIVAEGTSTFGTITAKSGVKLEEKNLVNSEGFGEVIIEEGAEGEIILEGNFSKVTVKAAGVTIRLPEGSKIAEITINAAVKIVGQGTIEKAVVSVNGVEFEKAPTRVEAAPGRNITIIIGGQQQTVTPPTTGGGGGGGGGGSTGGNTGGNTGGDNGGGTSPVVTYHNVNFIYSIEGRELPEKNILKRPNANQNVKVFIKELYTEYKEEFSNILAGRDGIITKALELESDSGKVYARSMAKAILVNRDLNIREVEGINDLLDSIVDETKEVDTKDIQELAKKLSNMSFENLEADLLALYGNKKVSDLDKGNFKFEVPGFDNETKTLNNLVSEFLAGKQIKDYKGQTIKIQLGSRIIEIVVGN